VKQNLADLPIVRGNPDASSRVDLLVDELYMNFEEVRKAVDTDPPVLTKNDIRLHLLNVMAEQRRKRKFTDTPSPDITKRVKRIDEDEINSVYPNSHNVINLGSNREDLGLSEHHGISYH
jgi:hypothetical protein